MEQPGDLPHKANKLIKSCRPNRWEQFKDLHLECTYEIIDSISRHRLKLADQDAILIRWEYNPKLIAVFLYFNPVVVTLLMQSVGFPYPITRH